MTIQFLHKKKDGYKQETMHLAGNIADRYLRHLKSKGKKAPNLAMLATTALLMAAKIEQPISPSFNRMINLLPESQRGRIRKYDLIELEEKIVFALEFDFHYSSPITFLERYQRLFSVDQETDKNMRQIGHTSRQFCKYMQRNSQFLEFTPSQQAATALVLALNLCYSHVCESIGLVRIGPKFSSDEHSTKSDNGTDEFNKSIDVEAEET